MESNLTYTAEQAKALCWDQNYATLPPEIPDSTGLDWAGLESNPEIKHRTRNTPRNISIDITSYRGISPGAVHYYASIKADGIEFYIIDESGRSFTTGGYLGEEFRQKYERDWRYISQYRIEVCRTLAQEEIDEDPVRWEGYEADCLTNCFPTPEAAVKQALAIAKARFTGTRWAEPTVNHNYYDA